MDLMKMGQELLGDKLGDTGDIMDALSSLTSGEGVDLGAITEKLKESGLGEQLSSWLGDGENASVSADEVTNAFGAEQLGEVASKMGVGAGEAADSLSQLMPTILDKLSSGGNLLESLSSGESPLDLAKKFFN